jgi:hypothetical protein
MPVTSDVKPSSARTINQETFEKVMFVMKEKKNFIL